MKKIILILIIFLSFSSNVYANDIEDSLNAISEQLKTIKENSSNFLEKYPIGSIYITTTNTNPSTTIGGTWESFATGRTLVGVSSDGTVGTTGGSSSVTLTTAQMPAHTHSFTASGSVSSTFTGTTANVSTNAASHTHTLPIIKSSAESTSYGIVSGGTSTFGTRVICADRSNNWTLSDTSDAHYHTYKASGTVKSTFTGTKGNTSNTGSGTAFSVLNPYITVYMWKRTA